MSDPDHCQNHPDRPVTARCIRFNRRFCELDFTDATPAVACLSPGMYCQYRDQCLIWRKLKKKRRERR